MKGISNISAAWNEVSKSCTDGIWPACILYSQEHNTTLASVPENVAEILEEIGLADVEPADINQIVFTRALNLSLP
jgi:hypothetical protein